MSVNSTVTLNVLLLSVLDLLGDHLSIVLLRRLLELHSLGVCSLCGHGCSRPLQVKTWQFSLSHWALHAPLTLHILSAHSARTGFLLDFSQEALLNERRIVDEVSG